MNLCSGGFFSVLDYPFLVTISFCMWGLLRRCLYFRMWRCSGLTTARTVRTVVDDREGKSVTEKYLRFVPWAQISNSHITATKYMVIQGTGLPSVVMNRACNSKKLVLGCNCYKESSTITVFQEHKGAEILNQWFYSLSDVPVEGPVFTWIIWSLLKQPHQHWYNSRSSWCPGLVENSITKRSFPSKLRPML